MPAPSSFVVKKGSNIRFCVSSLMPGPVSETAITTQGPALPPPAVGQISEYEVRIVSLPPVDIASRAFSCQVDDHLAELARVSLDARDIRL